MSLDLVLSILVLTAIALTIGAMAAWRKGARQKAALMLLLAVVCGVNVAIWTLPDASGAAPAGRELR